MMRLSNEDVRKVASLAKLEIAEAELDHMSKKLLSVLDFVDQLNQVDTTGIEELVHPVDIHCVWRSDQTDPMLPESIGLSESASSPDAGLRSREAALQNAPRTDGEFFLVPPVLG